MNSDNVFIPIPEASPDTSVPTDEVVLNVIHSIMFHLPIELMVRTISDAYAFRDEDFGWLHYRKASYAQGDTPLLSKEQFVQCMSYLIEASKWQDKMDLILEVRHLLDTLIGDDLLDLRMTLLQLRGVSEHPEHDVKLLPHLSLSPGSW